MNWQCGTIRKGERSGLFTRLCCFKWHYTALLFWHLVQYGCISYSCMHVFEIKMEVSKIQVLMQKRLKRKDTRAFKGKQSSSKKEKYKNIYYLKLDLPLLYGFHCRFLGTSHSLINLSWQQHCVRLTIVRSWLHYPAPLLASLSWEWLLAQVLHCFKGTLLNLEESMHWQ